jgi:hypothetical protein
MRVHPHRAVKATVGIRVKPHRNVSAQRVKFSESKMNMKIILLLTCVITLLSTAGCIFREDGGREHARYEHRDEVVVGPPVVAVRVPEVVVRPPEIIVR